MYFYCMFKQIIFISFVFITFQLHSNIQSTNNNGDIQSKLDIAIIHISEGKYEESIKILQTLLPTSKNKTKEKILYNLAKNYYYLNYEDSSIFYLTKIISNKGVSLKTAAESYLLLSSNYSNLGNKDLVIVNINKSIEIRKKYNDQLGIAKCYNNLGDVYYVSKNPKKALQFFLKANAILKSTRDLNLQINLSNIGAAYIDLNQLHFALPFINQANTLAKELNDELGQSICINNLATIYRDLGENEKALFYYLEALDLAEKMDSKVELKTIFYNLSVLYEKQKNITKALFYHKEYTKIKDELFNKEKNEFIVETQEKYEATERKREIAELKISEQEKEAKNFKLQVGIVASSILLMFLAIAINYRIRSKRREEENKNKLAIIYATMEAEENERKSISQNLHDDLGGILGISRMLFTKTKKHLQEQNPELYNRIDELLMQANNKTRSLSHELFSPTLKQFGLNASIKEYVQNIEKLNPDLITNFQMEEVRFDMQLEINIFRIVQELLSNTLKYANASKIEIMLQKQNNKLLFSFSDNGIGFNDEIIKKGVGLNSITDRILRFKGVSSIISQENKGFTFTCSIPL